MAVSNDNVRNYMLKLFRAKQSIVMKYPFFGFLLYYLGLALDEECETACTDGKKIIFGTDFLERLSDDETIFVMLHELMHCVLNHIERRGNRIHMIFNVAADIVVNSMILETLNINNFTLDGEEPMHLTPDGKEGKYFSTEEVYQMLISKAKIIKRKIAISIPSGGESNNNNGNDDEYDIGEGKYKVIDDHSRWEPSKCDKPDDEGWAWRIIAAAEHAKACNPYGHLPSFVRDFIKNLESHEVDWKTALQNFCQRIEFFDYSWMRGDRRYISSDLFLPEYTDEDSSETEVKDLLFFVDTSGSMNISEVSIMLGEIRSAISVFNGRLRGKLGFFDTKVFNPVDFTDEESFNLITPKGCGGTDFNCIFQYVNEKLTNEPPVAIIIMTDGYAEFPEESAAKGIPVLWVVNNSNIRPPWGETICVNGI